MHSDNISRLKIYVTVNGSLTFIMFYCTMRQMYACYCNRNKTLLENIKAQYNQENYYNQIDLFDSGAQKRNDLGQKIMDIIK